MSRNWLRPAGRFVPANTAVFRDSAIIMGKMSVCFENKEEANQILELARYANVESHKPLVEDELLFIARFPKIAKKLLTLSPLDE